jgi:MFS family permease
MAIHVRHPIAMFSAQPGAWTFTLLFFLESIARGSLATVMPLVVYETFGDKQSVSLAYTAVSVVALGLSFTIPIIIRHLSRRWSYSLGVALLVLCTVLLNIGIAPVIVTAMLLRTFGAALLNITLNLYIMDNIQKQQLVRSEPQRYAIATVAWTIAPLLEPKFLWCPAVARRILDAAPERQNPHQCS